LLYWTNTRCTTNNDLMTSFLLNNSYMSCRWWARTGCKVSSSDFNDKNTRPDTSKNRTV